MATLATGPVWVDHTQEGQTFSVRHLHPSFIDYQVPAVAATKRKPGRAAMNIKVRVSYSHHCFTQALDKVPGANPDHYYNCTKRPNDPRVFCAVRWNESMELPEIMSGVKNCYFTRHHNYFVWRNPKNPELGEYFVYFDVKRRGTFVEIEIESAYPRSDGDEAKAGAAKVSLTTLVVNAANGKATRRPPV